MKEQIIQLPDTLEIKEIKDNKIILVEKEKKLTYEDITKELFEKNDVFYININGNINNINVGESAYSDLNNCTSRRQAKKLLALNKLMTVAKYLNDGWQPDWGNVSEIKYTIACDCKNNSLINDITCMTYNWGIVYFKSKELAQKAIEILGEETIKLALCTDY